MRFAHPFTIAFAVTLSCLATATFIIALALWQPSLGLDLAIPDEGEGLVIAGVDRPGLEPLLGRHMLALGAPGGPLLPVDAATLIEEPDKLNDGALIRAFREDQDRLRQVLAGESAVLLLDVDGAEIGQEIPLRPTRPLADLPIGFWAQLFTGVAGVLIGGWIWAMNPGRASHVFLFLTAIGLMASACSAALYSGRELALSRAAYEVLAPVNSFGSLLFGAGLIGLFLCYPRQLARPVLCWLPFPILLGPVVFYGLTGIGNPMFFLHLPIVLALSTILTLLVVQWVRARQDPLSRAALKLVAFGIILGAGGFVLTTTLPALLGLPGQVSQAMSFPLFLLVFGGVALAVRRYRFFDLERWSFRLLFYVIGGLVLVLLDAVLVYSISSERRPMLGALLLVFLLLYLPLRDWLARLVFSRRRKDFPLASLVRAADAIALARDREHQEALWHELLTSEFAPLAIEVDTGPGRPFVTIEQEGAALAVPAIAPLPALRLSWKDRGRSLFSPEDARQAQDILAILKQLVEGRQAFEAGMNEERERIARDVHDNLGIRLNSALGQSEAAQKDALIRETFTDIRRILTRGDGGAAALDDLVADLRNELGDYLEVHGMACDWPLSEVTGVQLSPGVAHALRSLLRESVHNAVRHSGASSVRIEVLAKADGVKVSASDNGGQRRGRDSARVPSLIGEGGNGLQNLRRRILDVGGRASFAFVPGQGFRVEAEMPFTARRGEPEASDRDEAVA
ncbi:MAG: hypothetical protein GYB53_12570 [Rhodobacteraceae bacterium]|nr:hypothetical protein [Paracoccaceae bacterium]MBR9822894.1 hypothetical protein [Paracoccaceae bacterium]